MLTGLIESTAAGRPSLAIVLATAALAFALVVLAWAVVGHAITIAHEGSHAVTAVAVGTRVDRVKLRWNRDGETNRGPRIGGDDMLIRLAGYWGPTVFGLAGATALAHGRVDVVLWASIGLLVLLLTTVRNLFGLVTVVLTGLLLATVARRASADLQTIVACTWIWLLLLGGYRGLLEHRWNGGDFHNLRQQHGFHQGFWFLLSWLLTTATLVAGALVLVGAVDPPV